MAIRECLTIGSTSPPTPPAVTPPERLPRLFLACSFLPSVLFHFIWISDLAPFAPYDFVFYVLLSLACIPFDYLLIYHLFPPNAPGKHAREAYMWYSEWCFHGGYFLVCPNFLIWRGMETTTLPLGVRIPLAIVLAFLSFMAFIFGIIGMMMLGDHAKKQDIRDAWLVEEGERELAIGRAREAAKLAEDEEEDFEDARVYIS